MVFMKNIMSYISCGIIIFLSISCIFLKISNHNLEKENKQQAIKINNLEKDNNRLIFSIEKQNKEIKKSKIDFEKYANEQHMIITSISKKYDAIKLDNTSCETELESMQELLKCFNENK